MEYAALTGLQARDYTYPGEENAFALVKKIPFIDQLVNYYLQFSVHTTALPSIQGDCFRVTEKTCPKLHRLYQQALTRLDMAEEYPLYVRADYSYNAAAYGGSSPFILVHSSVVSDFTDQELLYIIGHEIGHLKSAHSIYVNIAMSIGKLMSKFPALGNLMSTAYYYALVDWQRMHEYTADRAGMIAAGGHEPAVAGLGKLLGLTDNIAGVKITLEDLILQTEDFELANANMITKAFCGLQLLESCHPWTILRVKELLRWKESGEFDALIQKFSEHD